MFDEQVSIIAEGLQPFQDVTVCVKVNYFTENYGSEGHYTASASGSLDLASAASSGGTYTGTGPGIGIADFCRPRAP